MACSVLARAMAPEYEATTKVATASGSSSGRIPAARSACSFRAIAFRQSPKTSWIASLKSGSASDSSIARLPSGQPSTTLRSSRPFATCSKTPRIPCAAVRADWTGSIQVCCYRFRDPLANDSHGKRFL